LPRLNLHVIQQKQLPSPHQHGQQGDAAGRQERGLGGDGRRLGRREQGEEGAEQGCAAAAAAAQPRARAHSPRLRPEGAAPSGGRRRQSRRRRRHLLQVAADGRAGAGRGHVRAHAHLHARPKVAGAEAAREEGARGPGGGWCARGALVIYGGDCARTCMDLDLDL